MKKTRSAGLFLVLALLLSSCARPQPEEKDLRILCTTYPLYLFTTAVTRGVDRTEVTLLVNSQTSCLHDYTLTVADMKAIEEADVIVMNGVGLEDFMDSALKQSQAAVIDASEGIGLLPASEYGAHEDHDHEAEFDPHYWMDPHRAGQAVENIANGLAGLQEDHTQTYLANSSDALTALAQVDPNYRDAVFPPYPLITFHDGFQYFAAAQGFELLRAVEEEDGAAVSAAEIEELAALIENEGIPAIFVERNGSSTAAEVLSRETGCQVYELDLLMSGDGQGLLPYVDAMEANLAAVLSAFLETGRNAG